MLATIRTDALETFSVEETKWKDRADTEAIIKLFSELGFRAVTDRVKKLFDMDSVDTAAIAAAVSETELAEASILLWLLESERTNASFYDILDYGKSFLQAANWQETVELLRKRVKEQGLEKIFTEIERPLIPVLASMKQLGILLDTKYLAKISRQFHEELATLEKSIYSYAGGEFNINSPKQLGVVLFDTLGLKPKNAKKTAGGQRSTKESELEKLRGEHQIIPVILRYRELQKLVSTYVDNLPHAVGEDGRIHSTLLQTGAATGRMASKDPNLQNIPIRTEEGRLVRGAFIADRNYQLVAIDYSQIELRIAAILSEDPGMIEIFKRGEDVHAGVASRVFGVPQAEVTPDMRRKAKVINFGILYGMGVNALRQNLGEGTPREEAQAFLNAYFQTFTRLAEYLEDTKTFARQHGYTETLIGRRRQFPGIMSSVPFIRAQAERMAINAPIQGTAADCMRIAMLRVHEYIEDLKTPDDVRMLLQVHDELIFEVKSNRVKEVVPKLVEIMEGVLTKQASKEVPLIAEAKVGNSWDEMQPITF